MRVSIVTRLMSVPKPAPGTVHGLEPKPWPARGVLSFLRARLAEQVLPNEGGF